jgi:hypothetical protein
MRVIVAWLLTAMLLWVPVRTDVFHGETPEENKARMEQIATQMIQVAFDPSEKALFPGPNGRAETALFLAAIAYYESKYDIEVDSGKRNGGLGEVCIMQVLVDWDWSHKEGPRTREGWSKEDLIKDRTKCLRVALHMLQTSQQICSDAKNPQNRTKTALTGSDQFTIYTGGKCSNGSPYAAHRLQRGVDWMSRNPVPATSTSSSASVVVK